MAEVKDVTLTITKSQSDNDKLLVKVDYKLAFKPDEVGEVYNLSISLFAEDKAGDDEPHPLQMILFPRKPIYTFSFGDLLLSVDTVTAQAGEQSFSESREVRNAELNEDPGFSLISPNPPEVKKIPHNDELYAVVSIAKDARSARSQTATVVI